MTAKSDQLSPAMLNALRRFFYVDTFGVNAAPMTVLRDEVGVLDSYARRGMANKSTVGALERRGLIVSTSGFATTARPVRTQLTPDGFNALAETVGMVDWDEVIGWAQTQAYAEDLIRTELAGKDLQGADITWWVRHKLSDAAVAVEAEGVYAFDWPTRRRIAAERLAEQWHMVRDSQTALASTIVEQARTEARYEYMQRALVTPGDHVVMDNLHLARLESRQADESRLVTSWAQYRANHPEVAASWGEQNGRPVNCTCEKCDPDQERPRPDVMLAPEFPEGTPEYAAYAAELRAELAKWTAGEGEYARTGCWDAECDERPAWGDRFRSAARVAAEADDGVLEVERAVYVTGDLPILTFEEISAA